MSRHSKTKITVETERVMVIRKRRGETEIWCHVCPDESLMVAAEQAAAFSNLSRREIYRLAEAGQLHFTETADGVVLICLLSLRQWQSARISTNQNH